MGTSAKAKMQSEILALKAQKLQVVDPDAASASSTALEQKLKDSEQKCMQAETALARERETSDQLRRACDAVEIKLASVLASESEMKELMFKAEAELKVKDDLQVKLQNAEDELTKLRIALQEEEKEKKRLEAL